MPITNNATYSSTMQQFIAHWNFVNAALAPAALTLANGYSRTDLVTDFNSLSNLLTRIAVDESNLIKARHSLLTGKTALRVRLKQFRDTILSRLPDPAYTAALPTLPGLSAIESRFLRPFDEAVNLWTRLNNTPPPGFAAPLVLPGNYTLAAFQTDLTALRSTYQALLTQQGILQSDVQARNALFDAVKPRLKQYRAAVPSVLLPPNALLRCIPRFSPVAGATPKPATDLIATYHPLQNTVHLAFTPSPSANLTRYELWFCPDAAWNADNAQKIAQKDINAPFAFDFPLDRVAIGSVALFKVVTINATGNERGSKVTSVRRLTEGLALAA